MKPVFKKVVVTFLVVEGRGTFPLDMLRYDSCCPATETDTSHVNGVVAEVRRVVLRRFSVSGQPATEGRWRSFGWRVVEERPGDDPPTEREPTPTDRRP